MAKKRRESKPNAVGRRGRAVVTAAVERMAVRHLPAWTVAEAKAKFSHVIEQECSGPQTITRNGRPAAVVVSIEEWERRTSRVGNLVEFFAASPLRGSHLDAGRSKDGPRDVEL
jgi:prevent-host-death family protein